MGASHSSVSGYWTGFVPRLQMVHVASAVDMERLVVPSRVVATCGLSGGDTVLFRDCLSRSFRVDLEYNAGRFVLGGGWADMIQKIDCCCGDELLLKYKGGTTWKVFVFCRASGRQKFPLRDDSGDESTMGESSYDITLSNGHQGTLVALPSVNYPAYHAAATGLGTLEQPIELDESEEEPNEVVYNASDRVISPALAELFDNLANTFELRVPLYYGTVSSTDFSCDFMALDKEYGKRYLLPILQEDGYPDIISVFLNGGDDPVRVTFHASADGSIVLSRGWRAFLDKHSIEEGADVVLRIECGVVDMNIHVYDF